MPTASKITPSVPALKLSDFNNAEQRNLFTHQLNQSLSDTGFVRIIEHGISNKTLQDAYSLSKQLFDLSSPQKQNYQLGFGGQRGYTAFGDERAKGSQFSDLKEFWHLGPELPSNSPYFNEYPKNIWPTELPQFRPLFTELYQQLQTIALTILEAIGIALKINRGYFPGLVKDGNSVLRLIHYPPVLGMDTKNQMRAAPHADINLMTLLVGASDSGLQLLSRDNEWVDVETSPDEIVVDTGDMMELITAGKLPATVHRVINPDNEKKARYSMPFFLHPHSNAKLNCLPKFRDPSDEGSLSITAGDFLQQRLRENGLL